MGVAAERKAIETTYTDTCTVYGFEKAKKSGITEEKKVIRHENIKCALSQKNLKTTAQTEPANHISYDAKLFAAPELDISPGSHIEVSRMGHVFKFISSGEPFLYPTHQEIMLLRQGKA